MDKKDIFRKVGVIMAELNEQYQYLSENPESLNDLELELFSANSDFLAEHVKVLKKLNLATEGKAVAQEEKSPVSREQTPSDSTAAETGAASGQQSPVSGNEEARTQAGTPTADAAKRAPSENEHSVETVVPETEEAPARQEETPAPVEDAEPQVSSAPPAPAFSQSALPEERSMQEPAKAAEPEKSVGEERPVINEIIIPERIATIEVPPPTPVQTQEETAKPTLNDLISAQKAQSFTPRANTEAVKDLKAIISLNDKLLFIRDLFNGYSLAYSEAIELINRFDSFDAADNFLKTNYAAKNSWDAKPQTAGKFYELLRRRFPE